MEKLTILIPTDFTVQAEFAYLMVKKLEEKAPVDIHLLHVLSVPDTVTMDNNGKISTCGEIDLEYVQAQTDIALRKLDELQVQYGAEIKTHLVFGRLTDRILQVAGDLKADLIVMGTKGAWGLKEKLSGSATQMVARRSPVPVLSLMCDRSDLVIENILLVHNFNAPVNEDLQLMEKLIRLFNAKVHLLQIIAGRAASDEAAVIDNMKKYAWLNHLENIECHVINDTDVENGVVHFNQVNNMDIVCIGTHGKANLFHSSATEKLINHLFKPILSFHIN